jgi:hypothetical protein
VGVDTAQAKMIEDSIRPVMDPFIGTAGVKRDKTAIHGGTNSFWCTASFYLILFGG